MSKPAHVRPTTRWTSAGACLAAFDIPHSLRDMELAKNISELYPDLIEQ
ncbi:MAG TPA: hypothetical protein VLB68_11975 [Pyrinomonadaceae bacterium]|nr:hypothetical protein [Pyrinomonadaceae bacterium]